jgi:mRNA deadenylase 3'-5' endonuclease subunit Ccr4
MLPTPGDAMQIQMLLEEIKQEKEAHSQNPATPQEISRRANVVDKLPPIPKPRELTAEEKERERQRKRVQYYLGTPIWKKGNLETM